jgi:hypothetical protein
MSDSLIPHLIEYAARRQLREEVSATEVRSVKLVVILTETEARDFAIGKLVSSYLDVSLKLFDPKTFVQIVAEYVRRKKPGWPEATQQRLVNGLEPMIEEHVAWSPRDLGALIR